MSFDPTLELTEVQDVFLDSFRIIDPIYIGGQGAVFKASTVGGGDVSVPSLVALKLYFPEQLSERTDREVHALGRITSPQLVKLVDNGRVTLRGQDCVYVATEFIQGEVLSAVLRRGALPLGQVARIGTDISTAIAAIWEERIVHRDIKPSNIMMAEDQGCVLIDLGVARHLTLDSLTAAGMTWGTSGYMAPEHASAPRQLSCKADIFSLGIVLQESILGRHPVNGRQDLLMRGGPETRTLRTNLPPMLCEVIDSMVNRDAVRRPLPSAVKAALAPCLSSEG